MDSVHALLQIIEKHNSSYPIEETKFYGRHFDEFKAHVDTQYDKLVSILDKMYAREKLPEEDMLTWEMLFLIRDMSRLFPILRDLKGLDEFKSTNAFKCMESCHQLSPQFEGDTTLTPRLANFFNYTVKPASPAAFFMRFQDWIIMRSNATPRPE